MHIRPATKEDCPAMLQLIHELAEFEKAPQEVTVDPIHFEESGFGEKPVWWAFVAVAEKREKRKEKGETGNWETENGETGKPVNNFDFQNKGLQSNDKLISGKETGEDHTGTPFHRFSVSPFLPSTSIIGFALYYIRYSTWKGQVMYLEDLLVTEAMRGQGIGSKLIERLMEEAKEKGFKRICWQVLDWNEPAINFYKKLGAKFDPEWVNVVLDL